MSEANVKIGPLKREDHLVVRGRVELPTFRFPGERPRPYRSTGVRLISPDDLLGHLDVQDRPHASTAVVSNALAVGLRIR